MNNSCHMFDYKQDIISLFIIISSTKVVFGCLCFFLPADRDVLYSCAILWVKAQLYQASSQNHDRSNYLQEILETSAAGCDEKCRHSRLLLHIQVCFKGCL